MRRLDMALHPDRVDVQSPAVSSRPRRARTRVVATDGDRVVVLLVSGLPPERVGGAEAQAAEVARLLARSRRVVVLTRTGAVPDALAAERDCTVLQRSSLRVPVVRFFADVAATLGFVARNRRRIAVILAYQTVIDGFIAAIAKHLFGIPCVVSVRSEAEYRLAASRQSRWLAPFVFRAADRIFVQSPLLAAGLLSAFAATKRQNPTADELSRKLRVIPNGVRDVEDAVATRDLVLFVARLTAVKGADYLIDAMRQCPYQQLVVIGDGPRRAGLERRAHGLTNVTFAGGLPSSQVHAYLSRARVLVLPSLQEGQPNVILEAMAHGTPVIASRVGGIPDLVEDGETGWLIEPRDTAALARHIRSMWSDADTWERMSRRSREVVARYHWPHVMTALEQELSQVITGA